MLLPIKIETEIEKFAVFTYLLIAGNVIVFLGMRFLTPSLLELAYYEHGLTPDRIDVPTLFTSMFVHAGWLHIIGNMYFLWLFGRAIEQRLGRILFIALYFCAGIAGGLLQSALTPDYLADIPCIGASGAIAGILGAYLILYPWEKVSCIYFSFAMRYATSIGLSGIWVLGSWFLLQFVNALWFSSQTSEASVGFWAHIGGFAFGALAAAIPKYSAAISKMLQRRSAAIMLEEYSDLLKKGKTDEASAKLKAALDAEPSNSVVLGELGRLELARKNRSRARKLLRRSLKKALAAKDDAKAIAAYLALVAAGQKPPDNSRRLIIGRRFARLGKHGHALGIMGGAFKPDAETPGLDRLLFEIAELFAGPLKDYQRASLAFNLLQSLFPHSARAREVEYRLRTLYAKGRGA